MNKIVLFIFLLSFCMTQETKGSNYPQLFYKVVNGKLYLVDEGGVLRYSMNPPHVTIDIDNKIASVYPTAYYAIGTTYYGETYDYFYVLCSYGGVRYSVETIDQWFDVNKGETEFTLPITNGYLGTCTVWSYVTDQRGIVFKSREYTFHYHRNDQ